jgi:hypothetical protein
VIARRLAALPDRALWLAIGGALFALAAWPLLLVELPPFQDLPNRAARPRPRRVHRRHRRRAPATYRVVFAAGDLAIWARGGSGDLAAERR